jgi:MerR family transcriptional regulator, light-induced transcriptional regulator
MGTKVRPIRFQTGLLDELEERLHRDGEDLSQFVNAAVDRALHGDERTGGLTPEPPPPPELLADAATAYVHALLARDDHQARAQIEDLVHRGARIVDIYTLVLAPALEEIGELWSLEQISVAEEHYATEVTAQLLTTLAPDRRLAPTRGRLAVVTASPDELHALGARMLADLLERGGWEVIALGAAAPADALADLVAAECPDVVALSTSTVGRLPGAEEAVGMLDDVRPRPLIVVGGALYHGPVADLARTWGADIVTSDLAAVVDDLRERYPPTNA